MRILVVKLADIGDLLVATPALAALRETFPAARIDLLTTPHSAPALDGAGLVDTLLTFDKFAYDHPTDALRPAHLGAALRLAAHLRARRYDTVLVLHHLTTLFGALKYAALVRATGARDRIGLDNGRGRWVGFTRAALDRGFGVRHEAEYWLDVAAQIGAHTTDPALRVAVRAQGDAWTVHKLAARKGTGPVVVIHPGSGGYSPARRWDPASFAAVADALHERHGARIVLVGTADDDTAAVRAHMAHTPLDLADQTSLGQLAALLARADLFVGADSGVMHLAAAVRAPVVAIFGPSNHHAWGPWSPGDAARVRVVRSAPPCSPCAYVDHGVGLRAGCPARTCMRMVTPAEVLDAAEAILIGVPVPKSPPELGSPGPALAQGEVSQERVDILGVPVNNTTFDAMLDQIGEWVTEDGPPRQIATANPEFTIIAQRDVNFYNILRRAHLVIPDGVGLLWAARQLGQPLQERVTGSDGVPLIAARAAERGWRLFFLGAAPGVAARAAEILTARHPGLQVVGTYSGSPAPEEEDEIVARVRAARADILFVAYGAPRQDKWIARNLPRLGVKVAMGVGGAFDFIAGVTTRAPKWMQAWGLEWLDRLIREPWRWRRQTRLPRFIIAVLRQKCRRFPI
ncbi:MAG: WecB/TagA/CpsF family glycosyltransferase [Anaerolineae bacterium]|nr:WecB/TagA/CpsF family glycosyltransferase [Anaerolineae bacterium]